MGSNLNLKRGRPFKWQPPGDHNPITFFLGGVPIAEQLKIKALAENEDGVSEEAILKMDRTAKNAVLGWEGVDSDDGPAPCDDETKDALFAQFPEAQLAVLEALAGGTAKSDERKNASGGESKESSSRLETKAS
jgi:hypothetical protein